MININDIDCVWPISNGPPVFCGDRLSICTVKNRDFLRVALNVIPDKSQRS